MNSIIVVFIALGICGWKFNSGYHGVGCYCSDNNEAKDFESAQLFNNMVCEGAFFLYFTCL